MGQAMEEKSKGRVASAPEVAVAGSVAPEPDMSGWLSTYGLITVEKILERYGIRLPPEDLSRALHNTDCIFYRLIQLPLKNIFNGLIFQQAKDYQIYAQKLYIDYMLSSGSEQDDSQASEDLETTRQELVKLGETFAEQELAHERLIARSQLFFIQYARHYVQEQKSVVKNLKQALQRSGIVIQDEQLLLKAVNSLLSDYHPINNLADQDAAWQRLDKLLTQSFDLSLRPVIRDEIAQLSQIDAKTETTIQDYREQAVSMGSTLKSFRSDFSSIIVRTNELISMVTRYHIDEQQQEINQEDLYFDGNLGETTN